MGWQPPPSRMLWTGALLLLAALGGAGGARSCPLQLRGCKCVGERPKGLAPARKRVSCSGEELREPPASRLLPNGIVTLHFQPSVHGLAETGLRKQVKPHPRNAGST